VLIHVQSALFGMPTIGPVIHKKKHIRPLRLKYGIELQVTIEKVKETFLFTRSSKRTKRGKKHLKNRVEQDVFHESQYKCVLFLLHCFIKNVLLLYYEIMGSLAVN
jgi:hypothetical protein